MPPEQIDGADVDGRTDLYSLGCVMYEMFAGQRPFNAETPEALMIQHLYHQPPPLRSFRPDLAQDLAQLIEQMLAKEKEHRPSGAREVFARIGEIGVAVQNLESSRVTMLAPDPAMPPGGFDVFHPESGRGTMLASDPASPPAYRATQESEPVYRATQDSEPVHRGTELAEPVRRGTELAEPVYRGSELAEPVYRGTELAEPVNGPTNLAAGAVAPAKLGPPVWRGDDAAAATPPAGLAGGAAATHDADPSSAGYRGGPAAESARVVRFGPGLPQDPPGGRPPAPPYAATPPLQPSQPSWPDRQQIEARQREARQSQSPQRRPGRARRWLLTIGGAVVIAAIAAIAFVLLHRSHAALKVTAVAVAPATLPGHKCNITVDVVGTIETNGDAGQLMYQWVRNGDLTSRVFTVHLTAANGTSVTAHLHWRFIGKGVSHSTAQLRVLSPNVASAKSAFVYACRS
jgi:Protein kinase domain